MWREEGSIGILGIVRLSFNVNRGIPGSSLTGAQCSAQCAVFSEEKLRVGPKLRGFYFRAEFSDAILTHEAFLQKRGLQSAKPWTRTQMKQELFGSDDISSLEG